MLNNYNIKKDNVYFSCIFILLALIPFVIYLKGALSPDEGFYILKAYSILEGSVGNNDYYTIGMYPLFYHLLGLIFYIFGKSFYFARIFTFSFNAIAGILVYFIGKKIYNTNIGRMSSVLFLISVYNPLYEGYYALIEPFMLTFGLLGFYIFIRAKKNMEFLLTGMLIACSTLCKINGILFLITIVIFFFLKFCLFKNDNIDATKFSIKNLILVFSGFLLVIFIGGFYFWVSGSLNTYIIPIFSFIQDYGSSLSIKAMIKQFAYFPIIWIFFAVSFIPIAYKTYTRKIDDYELFLILWTAMFFGNLIIRNYGHYYIPLLAPICILVSISLIKILPIIHPNEIKSSIMKTDYRKIFAILCLSGIILFSFSLMIYIGYNLQEDRLDRFEDQIKVSEFIKSNTLENERILSFSFDPSIYILSDRAPVQSSTRFLYVGNPYIKSIEDEYSAIEEIKQNNVNYIVISKDRIIDGKSLQSPLIYTFILDNYTKIDSIGMHEIYLRNEVYSK